MRTAASVNWCSFGCGSACRRRLAISFYPVQEPAGHAFISYVHEDSDHVDVLQRALQAAGVRVWRDKDDLWPGDDWRMMISRAITDNALVFIACFSSHSAARTMSYQNEELTLAREQFRLRPPGARWLIPVRFDKCQLPRLSLGAGLMLDSIHCADLFGDRREAAMKRLVTTVQGLLTHPPPVPSRVPRSTLTAPCSPPPAATRRYGYGAKPAICLQYPCPASRSRIHQPHIGHVPPERNVWHLAAHDNGLWPRPGQTPFGCLSPARLRRRGRNHQGTRPHTARFLNGFSPAPPHPSTSCPPKGARYAGQKRWYKQTNSR